MWCLKAASVNTNCRARILGSLSFIVFSLDTPLKVDSPPILQTLYNGMFALLYDLSLTPGTEGEYQTIAGWILKIRDGECGTLNHDYLEQEYGDRYSKDDDDNTIRGAIMAEAGIFLVEAGASTSDKHFYVKEIELMSIFHSRHSSFHGTIRSLCLPGELQGPQAR